MGLDIETTADKESGAARVWDGVTSSAHPQACLFMTWCILSCVKLRPPRQPPLGHPERGGLQRCLDIHILSSSCCSWGWRTGLGSPGSHPRCWPKRQLLVGAAQWCLRIRFRDGAVVRGYWGGSLRRDVAVMQRGCLQHRNSQTFTFSVIGGGRCWDTHTLLPG